MSKRPVLAKSELEVARIVWELGGATVRQVLDALPAGRGLDFKTVQTYLRRLEAKGYLKTHRDGRSNVYRPIVRPGQVVGELMDDLLNRLFDGEVLPLFQHLVNDRGLSETEIRQLRELLDRLEGGITMTSDFDHLACAAWSQMWQVTIVVFIIGTIVRVWCRNRPRLAYALWMLVVIKAIVPPYWSSPTGVFSWALAARGPAHAALTEMPRGSLMASNSIARFNGSSGAPAVGVDKPGNHDLAMFWDRLQPAIIPIWAAGLVLCSAFVIAKTIVCSALIRRSRLPVDDDYVSQLAELARRLRVKRHVSLIVTSRPIGPAVFGLVRPSILMPEALLAKTPLEQVELVLAHELIHVRRGDIVAGKLQLVVQLIWWFHPLIWWANREACRARERCCDGEVVSGIGCKPARYARALLSVLEQKNRLRPLVAIPGVRAIEITSSRLESIMSNAKADQRRASLISRVVFVTGAVVLVPGMGLSLQAQRSVTDTARGTVETAPAKSAAMALEQDAPRSAVRRGPAHRRIVSAMTLEQNAPRSEGKTTEAQSAKVRWRAQQIVTRKAEADYLNARLTREIAEIAVLEYAEGIFEQDLATVDGEIKLVESDLSRSRDRLDWARRMLKKGYVPPATVTAEELTLKKARFALEQVQSKKKVLVDYTRGKTIKELKSEIEKARSDELKKKGTWEHEKSKESVLEREAIPSGAGRPSK